MALERMLCALPSREIAFEAPAHVAHLDHQLQAGTNVLLCSAKQAPALGIGPIALHRGSAAVPLQVEQCCC
jgi:hypothetical protein